MWIFLWNLNLTIFNIDYTSIFALFPEINTKCMSKCFVKKFCVTSDEVEIDPSIEYLIYFIYFLFYHCLIYLFPYFSVILSRKIKPLHNVTWQPNYWHRPSCWTCPCRLLSRLCCRLGPRFSFGRWRSERACVAVDSPFLFWAPNLLKLCQRVRAY